MINFFPNDVNLSDGLLSTFGCVEFERAACHIVEYLNDDTRGIPVAVSCGDPGIGWGKKFNIDTIAEIDPTLFAMLCGSGWIRTMWFPKGTFIVSDGFIGCLWHRKLRERESITKCRWTIGGVGTKYFCGQNAVQVSADLSEVLCHKHADELGLNKHLYYKEFIRKPNV